MTRRKKKTDRAHTETPFTSEVVGSDEDVSGVEEESIDAAEEPVEDDVEEVVGTEETTDEPEETTKPEEPVRKPRTMPFRVLVGNLYHEGRKCRHGEIIHLTPEDRKRFENYTEPVR